MTFNPIKRFQEDVSGTMGKVVVNICGYYFAASILAGLLFDQGMTWFVLINTALALSILILVLRKPVEKRLR